MECRIKINGTILNAEKVPGTTRTMPNGQQFASLWLKSGKLIGAYRPAKSIVWFPR